MLVLSRRENQKVCFPDLDITVEVLRVRGSAVRVGVEAPLEVRILRDEISDNGKSKDSEATKQHVIRLPRSQRHLIRNKLNSLSIALHLFKHELEAGRLSDAEQTFEKLVQQLEGIMSVGEPQQVPAVPSDPKPDSTALLVEDEPNEREMLAGFLRMHGYDVATAGDGVEAMEYLESNIKPAFMLIDMRMPRCDGPTTIRRIRENPAFDGLKIFAISGTSPEENQLDDLSQGVNQWFMKPLNPRYLVDAMDSNLQEPEPSAA